MCSIASLGSYESMESDLFDRKTVPPKPMFVDAEDMKAKLRMNLMKPQYDVANFYHEEGFWRRLATNTKFERVTLTVIAINSIYIGVDADYNKESVLLAAHPVFQVFEHLFCMFFVIEWMVRFMAFREKRFALRDGWFVFDSVLLFTMIIETWVITIVVLGSGSETGVLGNTSIFRMARLARLTRMARMARLLRVMPEVMILIKGMVAATRSVFFTLCLLCMLLYVFAVAFTQLTMAVDATYINNEYFKTVIGSMYTLLVYGTFMDDLGHLLEAMSQESPTCVVLFLIFVLLSALTVMNMLIGVLCEVVSAVAATEREGLQVTFVTNKLQEVINHIDKNGDGFISSEEFRKILECQDAVEALQEVGVDVVGLVDFAEHIFEYETEEDADGQPKHKELTLQEFMTVVLQLRGTNAATVKDVVDLRKYVRTSMKALNRQINDLRECLRDSRRASVRHRYPFPTGRKAIQLSRSPTGMSLDTVDSDSTLQTECDDPRVTRDISQWPQEISSGTSGTMEMLRLQAQAAQTRRNRRSSIA